MLRGTTGRRQGGNRETTGLLRGTTGRQASKYTGEVKHQGVLRAAQGNFPNILCGHREATGVAAGGDRLKQGDFRATGSAQEPLTQETLREAKY